MALSHKELDSIQAYGLHESIGLYQNSESLSRFLSNALDRGQTSAKYAADFLLDAASIPDVANLAWTAALGYTKIQRIVRTDPRPSNPTSISGPRVAHLIFHEIDWRETGEGAYQSWDKPRIVLEAEIDAKAAYSRRVNMDFLSNLQHRAQEYGVRLDVIKLIEAHLALGINYLVSDDPEVHRLRKVYFRDQGHRLIHSSEFFETVERLERRHGMYYIAPSEPLQPKGIYYWRKLHEAVPNFDRTWATTLYGADQGTLDKELVEFTQSLGDRAMSLLQLRDELELLAEDAPGMASEWEIVNKLNYFFVLVTGVFDNLAWLASLRHKVFANYQIGYKKLEVTLRLKKPKQYGFHKDLQRLDSSFYNLVDNRQNMIEIFYPVRDSIQHRVVLSGLVTYQFDDAWTRVTVRFDPSSIQALLQEEPSQHLVLNSWGVLETREHGYLVEPSLFCKKATRVILDFVDEALRLLDIPSMLANHPALLAKVNNPPSAFVDLLRKPIYQARFMERRMDFRELGNALSVGD